MEFKFNLRRLRALTFIAACVAVLATSSPAHADQVNRVNFFKVAKEGVEATMTYSTGLLEGFVLVVRGGTVAEPETFLNYRMSEQFTGLLYHEGTGLIPNEAFTSTETSSRLLVDTSSLVDFIHAFGTGGVLDIQWTKNGILEMRRMGTEQIRTRTSKITISGHRTLSATSNQGSFFGRNVEGVIDSTIGTNRELTVTVEH